MHGDKKTSCSQLGGGQWGGVCNSFWIGWENLLYTKIQGAMNGGEGGRTERGRTLRCWLKFLLPLSSSVVTREEKAEEEGRAEPQSYKLTGWKCCRGEQTLLQKLPCSPPPPRNSAQCLCAPQHRPGVSTDAPKRNASTMENLSTSKLNQQ